MACVCVYSCFCYCQPYLSALSLPLKMAVNTQSVWYHPSLIDPSKFFRPFTTLVQSRGPVQSEDERKRERERESTHKRDREREKEGEKELAKGRVVRAGAGGCWRETSGRCVKLAD